MKQVILWTLGALILAAIVAAGEIYVDAKRDCSKEPYISTAFCATVETER